MREQCKPSDGQLKELYEAAVDFKKAEPWELFYDADNICLENPADGSIGYCSVMEKGKTILRYSKVAEDGLEWQSAIPG